MGKKRKLSNTTKGGLAKRKQRPITLPGATWDLGASGPAARARPQVIEDAADIDPVTGEVRNPNGVKRVRKRTVIEDAASAGIVSPDHLDSARSLLALAEGALPGGGDPLREFRAQSDGWDSGMPSNIDRRTRFRAMWKMVPSFCRATIDAIVLNDIEIYRYAGGRMDRQIDAIARIRIGLEATRR